MKKSSTPSFLSSAAFWFAACRFRCGGMKTQLARDFIHAPLRQSRPEAKRLKRLLYARDVARAERAELEARGEGYLRRRFGALRGLLRAFGGKRGT